MKAGLQGDQDRSATLYRIRVKGRLDERWSDWFNGLAISYPAEDETLLVGRVPDQAALHGMLAKIWDLGLALLSIEQVEKREKPQLEIRRFTMQTNKKQSLPWWLFAIIAIGALLASGVYLGIMSVEGLAGTRLVQAVGFGALGLIMLWGATHRH